jgi:anaerobic ribonucleoside-triphosphate reductase activating protein
MNYLKITYPDINNGCGCRVTLWVAGCPHHCIGCHNPESWIEDNGKPFTEETKEQLFRILELPYIKGITLSGGEPIKLYNSQYQQELEDLLVELKKRFPNKDIWVYTGFTFEHIFKMSNWHIILCNIDVLVDGEFELNSRDVSLPFRGSSNQRLIDVPATLESGEIVEFKC